MPRFIQYQEQYANKCFQIISAEVGVNDARKLTNYKRSIGINFPVLIADPIKDANVLPLWGNPRGILPFSVVIGRDGHLHFMRARKFENTAFDDFILPLLRQP